MKKTTLLKIKSFVLILSISLFSLMVNSQCIRTSEFGNIVSNNSGLPQTLTTCAYSNAEYSIVSGLIVGQGYIFSAKTGSTAGSGTDGYVTITDASNTVIQHGPSPLTVLNISASTVRLHYADDASCAGTSTCHNGQVTFITSCILPSGLTSSDLTTTGATISWTAPSTIPSGGYDYYYSTSSTAPTTTTTPSGNVANSVVTANLTGLTPSTPYFVWVRSNCGTESSAWSASVTFTTLCLPAGIPYLQNFATYVPTCWEQGDGGDEANGPATFGSNSWFADGFGNVGSTGSAKYNLYVASANDWLITPYFALPASGYELRFKAAATQYGATTAPTTPWESDDMVDVLVSTGSTNWTSIYTFDSTNVPSNLGDLLTLDLDAYAGQTVRFAFRAVEGTADGSADIDFFVDDFEVRLTPSCAEPSVLTASSVTATSATLGWTEMGSATTWNVEYGPVGFTLGSGTLVTPSPTTTSAPVSGLSANTSYSFYVQANCGSNTSLWTGPYTFTTLCNPFGAFTENFDTTTTGLIPSCWSKLVSSTNSFASVSVAGFGSNTAPNNLQLSNSGDANADLFIITPSLTNLATGGYRLKFRMAGGTGYAAFVGTMTNPAVASTFTEVLAIEPTSTSYDEFIVDFPTPSTDSFIAIKHGLGGLYRTIKIDDVIWEPIPTVAPTCATTTATINPTCGNFDTVISWPSVSGADGYRMTMGTTSGGTDIANNVDLGNVLSYTYAGDFNATYYYTLVPYNNIGPATGCTQQTFTTFATGCYCTSVPLSNDGLGITNVQIGTTNFPNGDVVYFDNTATPVTLSQGLSSNVQITFATGYTYDTNIWIDFDNDLTFDSSELVQTGIASTNTNPTTLNASFTMPATAALGTHRMRIGTSDFGQVPPAPCYNGSYGVTLDFNVTIVAAGCNPPVATTLIVPNCTSNNYSVEVNVTALGSGTPSISDGTTTYPVTATGVVTVGPFANGSTNTLTLLHGSDSVCNVNLGTFTFNCPPTNDDCSGAVVLTVGGVFNDNAIVTTNLYATNSNPPAPGCASFSGGDVWYSVVVPASGSITVETNPNTGSAISDTGMAVYSGTCAGLTLVECDDDDSASGSFSMVALTGQTAGATLYVNAWRYGGGIGDTFKIAAYDASLATDTFDNSKFTYYPNPVNDVLNLSYSQDISKVQVMNLLGQEVLSKSINATQGSVNMSQLPVGTYLVKVTSDEQVKTIKVVKK